MKRFPVLLLSLLCFAAPLLAAPVAVTDLAVDAATSGFRHISLTWTTPCDTTTAATPSWYELRVSTFRTLATDADWNAHSGDGTYPYRIVWSTAGMTAGQPDCVTVTGLPNGQTCFFAIRSSTDAATWSAIDANPSRPFGAAFNTAPGKVTGHNYVGGTVASTATPTLAWGTPAPSATGNDAAYGDTIASYTVEVSRYQDFSEKIEKTGLAAPSWKTHALIENASYYWRVKAGDAENLYSASYEDQANIYFYVNAVNEAPAAFTLSSPAEREIVATATPAFQWTASGDADPGDVLTYTIFYSTAPDFSAAVSSGGLQATTWTPPASLMENATYYWKVYAVDASTAATISNSTGTFRVNTVNSAPLSFSLLSPADGSTVLVSTPTLRWEAAVDPDPGDGVSYTVLYASGVAVPAEYTAVAGLTAPEFITPSLQEDTTYWWKVQATDTHSSVTASAAYSFCVDAVHTQPAEFHLLASSGIVATVRPVFAWQSAGADSTYTLSYATAADFGAAVSSAGLSVTAWTPAADLTENASYYWKVMAANRFGLTRISSETWTIAVNAVAEPPAAFHLLWPAAGTVATTLRPALDWGDAIDPDPGDRVASYLLIYSTAADYSTATTVAGIATSSYTFAAALASETTYYWKAVAVSTLGEGTTSQESWYFATQNQRPGSFNLASPSGLVSATTVPFSWTAALDPESDAVTYTLYYSSAANFATSVSSAGISPTHCTLTGFAENTSYYWYVTAADIWGHARVSEQTLNFGVNVVAEPPRAFSLAAPADGATLMTAYPQFSWQASSDPDIGDTVSYTLWYSADPAFAVKTAVSGLTSPSYTATAGLSYNTTYYWQVFAVGSDGLSRQSATRHFLVKENVTLPAPARFTAALAANKRSVALAWEAVTETINGTAAGAVGYRVYRSYDLNSIFTASALVTLSTGTLSWTDTGFQSLPVYYLVRACTESGNEGKWSVVQQVNTTNTVYSSAEDRTLTVAYSSGAVASGASIAIARRSDEETGSIVRSYHIEIERGGIVVNSAALAGAFTLTFNLPSASDAPARKAVAATISADSYSVYWFNGVAWVALGGTVSGDTIIVESTYAGAYQVRCTARAAGFGMLQAWPKIITPNGDGINDEFNYTFENPDGEPVTGKIFRLDGSCIARMREKSDAWLFWDGYDEDARKAAPGVYLYQVTCGDGSYSGTVVVAR